MGSLSEDGLTIFSRESFEQGLINERGEWVDKSDSRLQDESGNELHSHEASFKSNIQLSASMSIDDFLLYNAKSAYQMTGENISDLKELVNQTEEIYYFPFNYVQSYYQDTAFLVANDNQLFMIVGNKPEFEYVSIENSELLSDESEENEVSADDFMDFNMM